MKRVIIISLLLILAIEGMACVVCGPFNYNAIQNNNFIGLFYRYQYLNGYDHLGHDHQFRFPSAKITHNPFPNTSIENTVSDYERYQTVELVGNWNINERYNLSVWIPYHWNEIHFEKVYKGTNPVTDSSITASGLGDIVIGVERIFNIDKENWNHMFRVGGAIELPTGKYSTGSERTIVDPAMQPGSGTIDWLLRGNYTVLLDSKWGMTSSFNYRINAKKKYNDLNSRTIQDYKFGNQFVMQNTLFRVWETGRLKLIPHLGTFFEYSQRNQQNGEIVEGTGGKALFLQSMLETNFDTWTLRLVYQHPVYDDQYDEDMGNAGRISTGIIKNF